MRILIIRHAEPFYEINSITEKGWREAEYLADFLENEKLDYVYVSPHGRAKDTIAPTLARKQISAQECFFLREFDSAIKRPDTEHPTICWDFLPKDLAERPIMYDENNWMNEPVYKEGNVYKNYEEVTKQLDELLKRHGYERDGINYKVTKPNRDTIVFVCHFGAESVLLSHLLHISPVPLWHGFAAAPSSITTLYSEERRKGIATFRMSRYADVSHLAIKGEAPSFAGRFCEVFDSDERHD